MTKLGRLTIKRGACPHCQGDVVGQAHKRFCSSFCRVAYAQKKARPTKGRESWSASDERTVADSPGPVNQPSGAPCSTR
jgi:endogenous inhibitor of DNA gyrase (YacG/DUF329 family)